MAKEKSNYNEKDIKELLKVMVDKEKQLLDTNMSTATGKIKDVHASRKIRIEIAKIKTALKIKDLGEK